MVTVIDRRAWHDRRASAERTFPGTHATERAEIERESVEGRPASIGGPAISVLMTVASVVVVTPIIGIAIGLATGSAALGFISAIVFLAFGIVCNPAVWAVILRAEERIRVRNDLLRRGKIVPDHSRPQVAHRHDDEAPSARSVEQSAQQTRPGPTPRRAAQQAT